MVKNRPANTGDVRDLGLIPGLGRSPRGGNGSPLQYSCLENPVDRGAWWATAPRVAESDTTGATTHVPRRVNTENYECFESIQFYFSIVTTIFNNFKKSIKQSQRVMTKDDYMTLEH